MALTNGHPPAQLWQCQQRFISTPERCLTSAIKLESLWLILIRLSVDGFVDWFINSIFIQSRHDSHWSKSKIRRFYKICGISFLKNNSINCIVMSAIPRLKKRLYTTKWDWTSRINFLALILLGGKPHMIRSIPRRLLWINTLYFQIVKYYIFAFSCILCIID